MPVIYQLTNHRTTALYLLQSDHTWVLTALSPHPIPPVDKTPLGLERGKWAGVGSPINALEIQNAAGATQVTLHQVPDGNPAGPAVGDFGNGDLDWKRIS